MVLMICLTPPSLCSIARQSWLDARERVGDDLLTDFNGMPYLVPMGMVSTQVRFVTRRIPTQMLKNIKSCTPERLVVVSLLRQDLLGVNE